MELNSVTPLPTGKKRSDFIDYLKAIAIILVVVGHSLSYMIDKVDFVCSDLNTIQTLIYSVHVPLFFVVGGVLCHSQPFKKYLYKKINRLLIPFFFFSALKILYSNVVNASFAHALTLTGQLYDAFVLGKLYWFPYVLFLCYMAAPLFWRLNRKVNALICLACLLLSVIQANFPALPGSGWFGILLLPKWLGFFLAGYVIAQNIDLFIKWSKHATGLCAIALTIIVLAFQIPDDGESIRTVRFFVFSFSEMVILGAGMYAIKEGCVILRLIAKYSLQIMFMDSFFKVVLFVVVMKAGLTLNASVALILALVNLALCVIACRVLEKNRFTARLVGL